jgi:hypothetical protein
VLQFGGKSPIAGAISASNESELLARLAGIARTDVTANPPVRALRVRHCIKDGQHLYLFFNEGPELLQTTLTLQATGPAAWVDTPTGRSTPAGGPLELGLNGYATALLHVAPA